MIKLKYLLLKEEEETDTIETNLDEPRILSEKGYSFLKNKIDELNKKAIKWGVPLMELQLINEKFRKKYIVTDRSGHEHIVDNPPIGQNSEEITVKEYEVKIIGTPPSVEGYEFIAKIEHTPDGNILNYAPNSSIKHLPAEYRTTNQRCDVCRTNKDRNNTFVLKLEKEDKQRFPDKKAGDIVMIGSSCLKRFLPNSNSATSLMDYAKMINEIKDAAYIADEMEDEVGFGGGSKSNYISQQDLGFWLAAEYLQSGKYFSKKKALEFETSPTIDLALSAMYSKMDAEFEDPLHKRVRIDAAFEEKANKMRDHFIEWIKTKDFDGIAASNPDYADFYNNLKVISKQEYFKYNNTGLFSALFQVYLKDQGELEKKAAMAKSSENLQYLGNPGEKLKARVKVNKIKEYETDFGQGLIIKMEASTADKKGNLLYFTSKFELDEGEEADVEFTVKTHQPNKFTQIPETIITRMKVLNFISNPIKNKGKEKVKDLRGIVEIGKVNAVPYFNAPSTYSLSFAYDTNRHPDMQEIGHSWGVSFIYKIPDEATYNLLKPYENKFVEATWSLEKPVILNKLKDGRSWQVIDFKIIREAPPE